MYTLRYSTFRRSKPGLSEELIRWMGAFLPVTYHMKYTRIRVISVLPEYQRICALKTRINFQYCLLKYIAPPNMNHWFLFVKSKMASLYPFSIQTLSTKLFIHLISIMVGVQSLSTVPMGQALPMDSCILSNWKTRTTFGFQWAQETGKPQFQTNCYIYIYTHTLVYFSSIAYYLQFHSNPSLFSLNKIQLLNYRFWQ